MKRIVVLALGMALVAEGVQAADVFSGNGALALAALVGLNDPNVSPRDRKALSAMLDGNLAFAFPAKARIKVVADAVTCRASNVDISEHDCTLRFGAATRQLKGRAAHELFATLLENGVAPDGAAGSIFAAVSHLSCMIKPDEIKQRGGGGADCTTDAGPGS